MEFNLSLENSETSEKQHSYPQQQTTLLVNDFFCNNFGMKQFDLDCNQDDFMISDDSRNKVSPLLKYHLYLKYLSKDQEQS